MQAGSFWLAGCGQQDHAAWLPDNDLLMPADYVSLLANVTWLAMADAGSLVLAACYRLNNAA